MTGDLVMTCREFAERTRDYWTGWVRRLAIAYDWQDAIIRAAISLKLSNFEETGGIVAALTTSVPEAPGIGTDLGLSLLLAARRLFCGKGAESPGRIEDDGGIHFLHPGHCGRGDAAPSLWSCAERSLGGNHRPRS